MQRVLLSCKSQSDARFLKSYLEAELPFEVMVAADSLSVQTAVKSRTVHLLILQTGKLAPADIAYARQLRESGFNYPMLMITDSINEINIEEANEKQKVYFLERPFELRTLRGLARKLMVTRNLPQQLSRRYRTNLGATLETFISGEKYASYMFNLARGAAYFETTKKVNVAIGDLLRFKIHLADVERERHVHGRVVWTTHKGHAAGGYGLGIKFMKSTDVYRGLLSKV